MKLKFNVLMEALYGNNLRELNKLTPENIIEHTKKINNKVLKLIQENKYHSIEALIKNGYRYPSNNKLFSAAAGNQNFSQYFDLFYSYNIKPAGLDPEEPILYDNDLLTLLYQDGRENQAEYLISKYSYPTIFVQQNNYLQFMLYEANINVLDKLLSKGFSMDRYDILHNVETNLNGKLKTEKFFNLVDFLIEKEIEPNVINHLLNEFVFNSKKMTEKKLDFLKEKYNFTINNDILRAHYTKEQSFIFNNNEKIISKYIELGMNLSNESLKKSILKIAIDEGYGLKMFNQLENHGWNVNYYTYQSIRFYTKVFENISAKKISLYDGLDLLCHAINKSGTNNSKQDYLNVIKHCAEIYAVNKSYAESLSIPIQIALDKEELQKTLPKLTANNNKKRI